MQPMKILNVNDKGVNVIAKYDKYFHTDEYEVYYNTESGFELIRGINGHEDPFALDTPVLLDIGIMGHCKNKCAICYQGNYEEEHMTIDNFRSIIIQSGITLNQVALGGRGDPNHHPHFKEIIEYCRNHNVVPNYTTSGIDLTDDQVEISKMCGAVAVSDYGQDFTFDAIKKFQDAGIKTNIHLVFSKVTYQKCIQIAQGDNPWKEKVNLHNLNAVIFLLFKAAGRGMHLWDLVPDTLQLSTFSKLLLERKSLMKVGMDSCLVNHTDVPKNMEIFLTTCEGARQSAYISPSMMLLPCSFMTKDFGVPIKPGYDNIERIWRKSDLFTSFRHILQADPSHCPAGY